MKGVIPSAFLRAMTPVTPEFPHIEGEFLIIGPECFTLVDDPTVISWRGQNYTPQRASFRVRWHNFKVALISGYRWRSSSDLSPHWIIAAFKELI